MPARHRTAAGVPVAAEPIAAAANEPKPKFTLSRYRKTIAAVIGAGITWATVALVPNAHVTNAEWVALAVAVATALGVYAAPNTPPAGEDLEAGYLPLDLLVWVLIAVILVLVIVFLAHRV